MKKILHNWRIFEIILLLFGIICITISFCLGNDRNVLSFIASLFGVTDVLLIAKGFVIAPYIDIVYNVLYSICSINQRYYGEAIIYTFVMMPISLFAIISWKKNKNSQNKSVVKVNSIKGMEYIYLAIFTVFATFGFYFLLKALNTSELYISTISLVSSLVASYLMLRRCKYYAFGFILNDLILIALWSIVVKNVGVSYLPTLIGFFIFLINDCYGFLHWHREEKKQNRDIILETILDKKK